MSIDQELMINLDANNFSLAPFDEIVESLL